MKTHVKFLSQVILTALLSTAFVSGCSQKDKQSDEPDALLLETETPAGAANTEPDAGVPPTQIPTTQNPDVDPIPDSQVAPARNTLPEATFPTTSDETSAPNPLAAGEPADSSDDYSPEQPEQPEPSSPSVPATSSAKAKSKAQLIKKTVKFKLSKKSTAQVVITEDGKGVKVAFTAAKVKSGKYMLFMEKSCKKNAKSKPLKVAQFIVKKGDKFSGNAKSKAMSLKAGKTPQLKGKALVLYHGPRANTRLSCQMVK